MDFRVCFQRLLFTQNLICQFGSFALPYYLKPDCEFYTLQTYKTLKRLMEPSTVIRVLHPSKLTRLSNLKFQFEVLAEFNILTICCKLFHFYNTTILIDNTNFFAIYFILQHIFYHNQKNLFIGTKLIEKY